MHDQSSRLIRTTAVRQRNSGEYRNSLLNNPIYAHLPFATQAAKQDLHQFILRHKQQSESGSQLIVEIGIGDGENLLSIATNNPQHSYIGVELWPQGAMRTQKLAIANNLDNVRVYLYDWRLFVDYLAESACEIDGCLLLYPDPWPKKRHAKRRLFSLSFLKRLAPAMTSESWLLVRTDIDTYHEHCLDVIAKQSWFSQLELEPSDDPRLPALIDTKFATKGRMAGRKQHSLLLNRTETQ